MAHGGGRDEQQGLLPLANGVEDAPRLVHAGTEPGACRPVCRPVTGEALEVPVDVDLRQDPTDELDHGLPVAAQADVHLGAQGRGGWSSRCQGMGLESCQAQQEALEVLERDAERAGHASPPARGARLQVLLHEGREVLVVGLLGVELEEQGLRGAACTEPPRLECLDARERGAEDGRPVAEASRGPGVEELKVALGQETDLIDRLEQEARPGPEGLG